MSDYIRREDAVGEVEFGITLASAINIVTGERTELFQRENDELRDAVKRIEALPAADVVPVVHGKWIPHSEKSREYIGTVLVHVVYDYWLCDTCGYRVENGQPMYNFCPNCGAKMDGKEE